MPSVKQKCKKCEQIFVLDSDDLGFYEKMEVPNPRVCPDCRFKMRALFRNETTLYSGRQCGLCGKNIVSMYNPKSPYIVYCHDCYQSDKWDSFSYAKEYDFHRSFFEQLKELLFLVPKATTYRSIGSGPNINSDYVNMAGGLKNCYMVFNTGPSEEVLYSRGIRDSRDCVDIYFGVNNERCYECVNIHQSSGILWSKNINGSVDSSFVLNCRGIMNCFGCVNLNNKTHYFLNEPITPEEYNNKVAEILGSYEKTQEFKKKFEKFSLNFPRRENNNFKNVNSTGEYLSECNNVHHSFEIVKADNCKYIFSSKGVKDSIGSTGFSFQSELLCEVVSTGYSNRLIGSYAVEQSSEVEYSFNCRNSKNIIGCDSLRGKQYCILNRQYTKKEYEKIREHIIKELKEKDLYGLMMPQELAPFAYNETIAQDNFPLTKKEAFVQDFRWEDDIQKTEGKETVSPEDIPDHIKDVKDSIADEILKCINCKRNYKIVAKELSFYRKMNIPIPRRCFYCRHQERIIHRGPYKFWNRNCDKCKKEITTNYAPDRPEIVYCEKCYQQEVY
ncbi:hypothetical protein A3A01_01095 [Candidatus Nomurabacteria bacterium RIFCSPLOWO2_01_FULL_39_17]|uniref:Zinc-binding domain-containing protein n=1 Tax=Candidatus Nomurabacteria bacterium RIFCSPLOWO2_01_FULL_39_17 TaxID=1801770 RepID=A0A1F6WVF9_9BACT|nr:MAG: hypothetical protein A3A01_01095 [Candidatus Nomurabacteria bacterium RIFCSPLOWO2_01_FULL_39_17]